MNTQTLKEKKSDSIRKIVDAAADIFAEEGFEGARVDEIAKRAGINKAMIYYRIGDKKALYTKVLHEVFSETAMRIVRNIEERQGPEEKLKVYIRNLADTLERNPRIPRIMMRELASGGRHVPEVLARDLAKILSILLGILTEGAEQGVLIETNPFIAQMMIVGVMAFYKTTEPLRAKYGFLNNKLADMDKKFPGVVDREIEKLVLRALKK